MFIFGGPVLGFGQRKEVGDTCVFIKFGRCFVAAVTSGIALVTNGGDCCSCLGLRNKANESVDTDQQQSGEHDEGKKSFYIHKMSDLENGYLSDDTGGLS